MVREVMVRLGSMLADAQECGLVALSATCAAGAATSGGRSAVKRAS